MSQRIYHIKRSLPELFEFEQLIQQHREHIRISVPAHICTISTSKTTQSCLIAMRALCAAESLIPGY